VSKQLSPELAAVLKAAVGVADDVPVYYDPDGRFHCTHCDGVAPLGYGGFRYIEHDKECRFYALQLAIRDYEQALDVPDGEAS